jgi:hypothetical protein
MKTVLKRTGLVVIAMLLLAAPAMAQSVYDGIYVLDGYGNVHTVDNAPLITTGVNWGWDVARDIALTGNETGVVTGLYELSGYGDVYAFGDAPTYPGIEVPYFGWDIARDVEVAVDYTQKMNGSTGYYVLDGFGGVFPVGDLTKPYFKVYRTAQSLDVGEDRYAYWGWDVAVDLEVAVYYDTTVENIHVNGYYILDKFGGVHWNIEDENGDVKVAPWSGKQAQPYFGWDIARAFEMTPTAQGYYLMDGYGGVHVVGDASIDFVVQPKGNPTPYFAFFGWDIAKDIELVVSETGFVNGVVVLDGYGGLHEAGDVTIQNPLPLFEDGNGDPWDIAKDLEISPFFEFVTDAVVSGP